MRILGAILILASSLGAGGCYAAAKKRRLETLRGLIAALERMRGEMNARMTPLPELCRLLAAEEGTAGSFFSALSDSLERLGTEAFSGLWREAAEAKLDALCPGELESFLRLGDMIGRYALPEQLGAMEACGGHLRTGLEEAQRDYPDQRRLGLGLGAGLGVLFVVVLL